MKQPREPLKASAPVKVPGRPRYLVFDRKEEDWWEPTYAVYAGRLEDLTLNAHGELIMRTIKNAAIHESMFPERFVVVPHLDNFTPGLN